MLFPIDPSTRPSPPTAHPALLERQQSFLAALGRQAAVPATDDADPARTAAQQFVASTFLMPLLKEVRAQNRAAPPFGPTQAEKALGPLMDAQLADRIVRSANFPLVDRLTAELRARSRVDPLPAPQAPTAPSLGPPR